MATLAFAKEVLQPGSLTGTQNKDLWLLFKRNSRQGTRLYLFNTKMADEAGDQTRVEAKMAQKEEEFKPVKSKLRKRKK